MVVIQGRAWTEWSVIPSSWVGIKLLVAASAVREAVQLLAGDASEERSMLRHSQYIFYILALSHHTERISKVRGVQDTRSTQKEGSR